MRAFTYSNLSLSDSCWRHVLQLSDKLLFLEQNGKLLRTIDIHQKMVSVTRLWSDKDQAKQGVPSAGQGAPWGSPTLSRGPSTPWDK